MADTEFSALLDFETLIKDRTAGFSGREWVFRAIASWLARPAAPRFFLLSGEPGSGKSAIAARLVQLARAEAAAPAGAEGIGRGALSAWHFCWSADTAAINPFIFASVLATQLAERYPRFRAILLQQLLQEGGRPPDIHIDVRQEISHAMQTAGVIFNLERQAAVSAFDRVVRAPLAALFAEGFAEPITILVDSLDEALQYQEGPDITYLLTHVQLLDPRVRFIVTSRSEARARLDALYRLEPEELSLSAGATRSQSLADTRGYVERSLSEAPDLAGRLAGWSPAAFVEAAIARSDGNFLYLRYLLKMLQAQSQPITRAALDALPAGLDGIYREFLQRLTGWERWRDQHSRILGILTVAQEPLAADRLATLASLGPDPARDTLITFRGLLDADETLSESRRRYALYHRSFADWLQDPDRSGDYACRAPEAHARIVDLYKGQAETWEAADWERIDGYGLRHLGTHLYALRQVSGYADGIYGFICRALFQAQSGPRGSREALAAQLGLALQVAEAASPPPWAQVVRLSLIETTLRRLAADVPVEVLGVMARAGQDERALGIAVLKDGAEQVQAFELIAEAWIARGDLTRAQAVWRRAQPPAQRLGIAWKADNPLYVAGDLLVKARQVGPARALALQITDEELRRGLLVSLIYGCIEAGDLDAALATVGDLRGAAADSVNHWLSAIAAEWVKRGEFTAALAVYDRERGIDLSFEFAQVAQGLLAQNQAAAAEALAGKIDDEHWHDDTLGKIAARWLAAGQPEEAWRVASLLTNARSRAVAQANAIEGLARAGAVDRGLALAETIAGPLDDARRDAQRRAIGAGLEPDGLATTLARVAGLARPEDRASVLDWLVRALEERGRPQDAAATAQRLEDPAARDEALGRGVHALAQAGQVEEALAVLGQIGDRGRAGPARSALAGALARAGRFAEARAVALEIQDPYAQEVALAAVLGPLAISQGAEAAVAELATLSDEAGRGRILGHLARGLAAAGETGLAYAAVAGAPLAARSWALLQIVEKAGVAPGDFARLDAGSAGLGLYDRAALLGRGLRSTAEHDGLAAALVLADSIADEPARAEALQEAAAGLLRAGQLAAAGQVVAAIPLAAPRDRVTRELVVAQAQAGQFDEALAGIARITDPDLLDLARSEVLAAQVSALAAAGMFEPALAAAEQITQAAARSEALGQVALALAAAGERRRAAELASAAIKLAQVGFSFRGPGPAFLRAGRALIAAGDGQAAAAAAALVVDAFQGRQPWARPEELLQGYATALAGAALPGQSVAVARLISDVHKRSAVLAAAGQGLAEARRPAAAVAIAQEILDLAAAEAASHIREPLLRDAGQVLAAAGQAVRRTRAAAETPDGPTSRRQAGAGDRAGPPTATERPAAPTQAADEASAGPAADQASLVPPAVPAADGASPAPAAPLPGADQAAAGPAETTAELDRALARSVALLDGLESYNRTEAVPAVALAHAARGDCAGGLHLIATLPDSWRRAAALAGLAAAAQAAGDDACTTAALDAIEDLEARRGGLADVARVQFRSGRCEQALLSLEQVGYHDAGRAAFGQMLQETAEEQVEAVLALAARILPMALLNDWLGAAAPRLAQAGQSRRAALAVSAIMDPWRQPTAAEEVALALSRAGGYAEAWQIVAGFPDEYWRDRVSAAVLIGAGDLARIDAALAAAGRLLDPGVAHDGLIEALGQLCPGDHWDLALAVAGRLKPDPAGNSLWRLTQIAASLEPVERGLELLGRLTGAAADAAALGLLERLVKAKRTEDALRLVAGMHSAARATEGRTLIARVLAENGQAGPGAEVARGLAEVFDRARALSQVAALLSAGQDPDQLARLIAEVLALTERLQDLDEKDEALATMGRELDAAGRPEDAREAITAIADGNWRKPGALADLATAAARAGRGEPALALAEAATQAAATLPAAAAAAGLASLGGLWQELAGEKGWERLVARAADESRGPWPRALALAEIGCRLARPAPAAEGANLLALARARLAENRRRADAAGLAQTARALAEPLADAGQKAQVLWRAADALALAGRRRQAAGYAHDALALLPGVVAPLERAEAAAGAGLALHHAGERSEAAAALAESLGWIADLADESDRLSGLRRVAEPVAVAGGPAEAGRAVDIATGISSEQLKTYALCWLAAALDRAGRGPEALALAQAVVSLGRQGQNAEERPYVFAALLSLCLDLHAEDECQAALVAAEALPATRERAATLADAALAFLRAGQAARGAEIAGRAVAALQGSEDPATAAIVRCTAAQAFTGAGRGADAAALCAAGLAAARHAGRPVLLRCLALAAHTLATLDGGATLAQVCCELLDVETWWQSA